MANTKHSFKLSVSRHGYLKTVMRSVYRRLRRWIEFEICVVECSSGAPYDWPDVEHYDIRMVTAEEFRHQLSPELDEPGIDWPFQRGDDCAASLYNNKIVGYSFYTYLDTEVRPGLVFIVPDGYVYGFKSFTAPSHRGRKLEPDRWKAARIHRNAVTGQDPNTIFYINVTNLESLAANNMSDTVKLGYAAYVKLFGRLFVFNSPGSKRHHTGFAITSGYRRP